MNKRKPHSWIKVLGRLSDEKKRAAIAKRDGLKDADAFNMYVAFSIDTHTAAGAMLCANKYIDEQRDVFGDSFEWRLAGGQW